MEKAQPTILVVEDDHDSRELVQALLEGAGYAVVITGNGSEALAFLDGGPSQTAEPPAVILTDLMMPVMGGWEFLSRLRNRRRFAMIPVVLLTASEERLTSKMSAAFDRCLRKPIAPSKLLDVVAEYALRASEARRVLTK